MPLETGDFILDLNPNNPPSGDPVAQGDDHLRLIKSILQETFPNSNRAFFFPRDGGAKTADFSTSLIDFNKLFRVSAASGDVDVTLPEVDDVYPGFVVLFRKTSSAGDVTLLPGGADTINGGSSIVLSAVNSWAICWANEDADWNVLYEHGVAAGSIANTDLADMLEGRFKGRQIGAGTGHPNDITGTQATAMLDVVATNTNGVVPGPSASDGTRGKVFAAASGGSWQYSGAPHAVFIEQQSGGTDGGTATSGAWQTRVLTNTNRNVDSFATLSANQISLPAGDYYIEWEAPAVSVDAHQTRLRNITDGVTAGTGSSEFTGAGGSSQTKSRGAVTVSIAGTKVFEVQHQVATTKATVGFGTATGFAGTNEVYTRVHIWRL